MWCDDCNLWMKSCSIHFFGGQLLLCREDVSSAGICDGGLWRVWCWGSWSCCSSSSAAVADWQQGHPGRPSEETRQALPSAVQAWSSLGRGAFPRHADVLGVNTWHGMTSHGNAGRIMAIFLRGLCWQFCLRVFFIMSWSQWCHWMLCHLWPVLKRAQTCYWLVLKVQSIILDQYTFCSIQWQWLTVIL